MKLAEVISLQMAVLKRQRDVYVQYRQVCLDNRNHHGVQDASSDLREIEAQLEILKWVLE